MFPKRMGLKKGMAFWCSFGRKRWCVMVCPHKVSPDFIFSILLIFTYQFMNQFRLTRYHPRRLSFPIHIYRFASDFWKRKTNSRTWRFTTVISQSITFNKSRNGHWKIQQFIPIPGTQMTPGLVILNQNNTSPIWDCASPWPLAPPGESKEIVASVLSPNLPTSWVKPNLPTYPQIIPKKIWFPNILYYKPYLHLLHQHINDRYLGPLANPHTS